jgi:hypothetical protein
MLAWLLKYWASLDKNKEACDAFNSSFAPGRTHPVHYFDRTFQPLLEAANRVNPLGRLNFPRGVLNLGNVGVFARDTDRFATPLLSF